MVSSNFSFLAERFPVLEKTGSLAEMYLYTDPNTCLYKMGSLAEAIVNCIFEIDGLTPPSGNDNTHANRIKILQKKNMLSKNISDILYVLRINRNEAVHAGYDSFEECRTLIEMTHTLSVWFMQIYGDSEFEPAPYVLPADIRDQADYRSLMAENERLSAELEKAQELAMAKLARARVHDSERKRRAEKANRRIKLSEKETRYIIDVLIEQENNSVERARSDSRKSFRTFQLEIMGFIAIFIGPLVLFTTSVTYGLPFPNSISETATIANRTGAILPFCLGALALFAFTYAIVYAYDTMDKIFTFGMASGFTVVAMQMSNSAYIEVTRVGLLGVLPQTSGILHSIGAIIGFGSMILWIMFCFRKSDRRKELRTREKNIRNIIYFYSGIAMMLSLGLFILNLTGIFGDNFPVVFVAECAILLFGGIACLIKGGLFISDKA